ncbi:hypothetical protein ACLOJK_036396, partial [Asimina triloba]
CSPSCHTQESFLHPTPNPPKFKMPPKNPTVSKPRPSIKRPHEPEVLDLPWEMRDEAMRR